MNWTFIGEMTIATVMATLIISVIINVYKQIKKLPKQPTTQEMFDKIIEEDMAHMPKLKIKPAEPDIVKIVEPTFNNKTRIVVSGMDSTCVILPGGKWMPMIKVGGMGANQTAYVDNDSEIYLKVSGMNARAIINKKLKRNFKEITISGMDGKVIWR